MKPETVDSILTALDIFRQWRQVRGAEDAADDAFGRWDGNSPTPSSPIVGSEALLKSHPELGLMCDLLNADENYRLMGPAQAAARRLVAGEDWRTVEADFAAARRQAVMAFEN